MRTTRTDERAPRLWLMEMSLETGQEALHLAYVAEPRSIVIANDEEVSRRLSAHLGPRPNDAPVRSPMASPPIIRLRITAPGFAPDHLNLGDRFLSRRARERLELGPQDVQYLEVEATGSTPEVLAQDYRAVLPLRTGDPLDNTRSDGGWREVHHLDGDVERLWRLRTPDPNADPLRIVWKEDFEPPGPLFVALGSGWLLATEQLAARAQTAGLTGLAFIDLENDGSRTETISRRVEQ